tara:strand:+ start:435 stop:647 length:213 start_codon:yes stop_codon:yes gene_type:complete
MENSTKACLAIKTLKDDVEFIFTGDITTEADFNKIDWVTGTNSEGIAVTTNTCPHSEIDWTKFKTEYDKL